MTMTLGIAQRRDNGQGALLSGQLEQLAEFPEHLVSPPLGEALADAAVEMPL